MPLAAFPTNYLSRRPGAIQFVYSFQGGFDCQIQLSEATW